jgi:hypothetical protein
LTVRDNRDIFSEIDSNRRRIHMITALREINNQTVENRFRTLDIETVVVAHSMPMSSPFAPKTENRVLPVKGSVPSFCRRTIDSCVILSGGALCSAD